MRSVSARSSALVSASPGGNRLQVAPASSEYHQVPFAAPTFQIAMPGRSPSRSFQLPVDPVGSSAAIDSPLLPVAPSAIVGRAIGGTASITGAAWAAAAAVWAAAEPAAA